METINDVRRQFFFTSEDQDNLAKLGKIILPGSDQLADDFYEYFIQNPETASYFKTDEAKELRKVTFKRWLDDHYIKTIDYRILEASDPCLEDLATLHLNVIAVKKGYTGVVPNSWSI
jgi:hypothetical protein